MVSTLAYMSNFIILQILVPHHTIYGALVQIFDFQFLADLHVLGSGEFKKHKISMVPVCSLVS